VFVWLQEAIAEEQRLAARYVNDIEIAKAQRDFELKKASYDQEVQAKKAQSDLAYSLQVCVVSKLQYLFVEKLINRNLKIQKY